MTSGASNADKDAAVQAVSTLYRRFLESWNRRDAATMAALFADQAHLVGFDGSLMNGPQEIETAIAQIFADHQTAPYVGKIRNVRLLTPDSAHLHTVAGMPFRGQTSLNAAANTIQNLVAVREGTQWRIALLQNTPAQFHGRPELSEALTDELQQMLEEVQTHGSKTSS